MKGFIINTLWILLFPKMIDSEGHCRSKFGVFTPDNFDLHACAWCYFFLYPGYKLKPHPLGHYLINQVNQSNYAQTYQIVIPDITNETSVKLICSSLNSDECERWKLCCTMAADCCQTQLEASNSDVNSSCPVTWDGFGCWQEGTPGEISRISCPLFLPFSVPTSSAMKTCQKNGQWLKIKGLEWTDYTPCLNYQELQISIYISIGCQIASLLCLVPSVFIFIRFRSLIYQHRIRLHVNFFISFILSGICVILWNIVVTLDRITNNNVSDTLLFTNTGGCKFLSFLKLYFTSTNYVWMFCEGIYLYRLIVNAFSPPKRLLPYYVFGWGAPLIYTGAYAIIRVIHANESCWAKSLQDKEWIIYTPNLFCLFANIFFLCSILRILLTKLQSHPNEPSNFRKAIKATFVLIPLFGVQLIVTIYRLPPDATGALHYERFSEVVINSQGLFVALIFCLCNGEVLSLIKNSWQRRRLTREIGSKKEHNVSSFQMNNTISTRYNSMAESSSPNRSLMLSHVTDNGEITAV